MRRRQGRRFGRAKRSVAWIDGLSGFNTATPVQQRTLTFAQVNAAVVPNTWGAALAITATTDLALHGGEDCVLERIRGRLLFMGGLVGNAGGAATSFFARLLIVQQDTNPTGQILGFDFTTSVGLGNDDILWSKDILISGTALAGNGTGAAAETSSLNDYWHDIDVRAKRKLQSDRHISLWLQSVGTGASQPVSCTMAGGLRILLKRPR